MNPDPSSGTTTAAPDSTAPAAVGAARWVNVGVLAHVDAGKTSVTEALLELGGAIPRRGRVDDGTTQTDTLAQERARGITIRAAVAAFLVDGVGVNLIDTPGHPDFIAEVDRSLAVLDGAVLVVSAVEGVQTQTIVLAEALRRLDVPTVVFINKIDRPGADVEATVGQIRRHLPVPAVTLQTTRNVGSPAAVVADLDWADPAERESLCSQLAALDDDLLDHWVREGTPTARRLRDSLRDLTGRRAVVPVGFGSARTAAGVAQLIDAVTTLFTSTSDAMDDQIAGQVFKIERSERGRRICTVRLRSGRLTVRDHVRVGRDRQGTVTAMEVHRPGGAFTATHAAAGQVIRVQGLEQARVGDWIGTRSGALPEAAFPPPALESTIAAVDPDRRHDLVAALAELTDIDPLIRLRSRRDEVTVSLYGVVQQEVIGATLSAEYGIEVCFGRPTVVCWERVVGRGSAVLRLGDPQHFLGYTMGVTVEPLPPGQGVDLTITAARSTLPLHVYGNLDGFRRAVRGYLDEPLATGPHGWPVTDVRVTVTESGYPPAGPRAADVRHTTAAVVATAIRVAGTVVCVPVDRLRVECPADAVADVIRVLGRHGVVPEGATVDDDIGVVIGAVRTGDLDLLRRELHGVAQGRVVVMAEASARHREPPGDTI